MIAITTGFKTAVSAVEQRAAFPGGVAWPGKPGRGEGGTSLLEVLITVMLLSIGLLGIAGVHSTGLKNVANANLRTQTSLLAYDILDRMRANRSAAQAGDYNIAIGTAAPGDPSTIVQQDLAHWKDGLARTLPRGDGAVEVAGEVATVTLQWTEREDGGSVPQTFQLNTRL
ncbi:MAG: type IV pilus modification protein PilV [Candidatus Competibacteraceae bacterium]|nr:type IV pilus modification protein PilV [Candidatus Competibacteraceae bacterium]